MKTDFMEETNKPMRDLFASKNQETGYTTKVMIDMMNGMADEKNVAPSAIHNANEQSTGVEGPLARQIMDGDFKGTGSFTSKTSEKYNNQEFMTKFGNGMIFAFAGHDTTGNTMTWMTFELARHPEFQARVQAEVDQVFMETGDNPLVYRDCRKMPFLTRCVMETLRLWPAVGNGTFRELLYDDYVKGPNGEDVKLPKGAFVQVTTMPRHRDPNLWGEDVHRFNPDRDFTEDELWHDQPFAAYNPSTKRFSPFTYAPRDCIGKNFAQMEMRTIMAHMLRNFTFELVEPYANLPLELDPLDPNNPLLGDNSIGTLGPDDLILPGDVRPDGIIRAKRGMYMRAIPRTGLVGRTEFAFEGSQ